MSSNAAVEGSVNEQQMSGEQKISRVNDILHLQAMKATYYGMGPLYGPYLDEFRRTQQGWRISSIRFLQEG